jgi:two-component system NtrC family sensor kinase
MNNIKPRYYKRLRYKLFLTVFLVSILPLTIIYAVSSSYYNKAIRSKIESVLINIAENRKDAIELFLKEKIEQLSVIGNLYTYDYLSNKKNLERIFESLQKEGKDYVDISIVNQYGKAVSYVGPYNLSGMNYFNEKWYKEAMVKGIYKSDVFLGFRRFPHFIIAIKKPFDGKTFIIRSTINIDALQSLMRVAEVEAPVKAFIINEDGIYQIPSLKNGGIGQKSFITPEQPITGTKIIKVHDANNNLFYCAQSWIPDSDWVVVVLEAIKNNVEPLTGAMKVWKILFAGGILCIFILSYIVSKWFTDRLYSSDMQRASLNNQLIQAEKMAAIGRLAAGIAHEINNPAAIINNEAGWMSDLIKDSMKDGVHIDYNEFQRSIQQIKKQVDRCKNITSRLLGFSRRVGEGIEPVNINQLLDEAIFFLEKEAKHENIEIVKDYQTDLPLWHGNASQMEQVFLNIITNAMDSIQGNGKITLKTELVNNFIEISINDTGVGIPKEYLTRIFEPFFSTKLHKGGTGLGLSICYEIIKSFGGDILVDSEPGKGTKFTIKLPLSNNKGNLSYK